jgi:uncharacterized membrane protein HdeD (DUF308 family)
MKFTTSTTTLVLAISAAGTSAFVQPAKTANMHVVQQQARVIPTTSWTPNTPPRNEAQLTRRFLSDNTANEFMNDMEKKAKENLPDFLYVDFKQAQEQIAKNWGWITTSGVLTMVLGVGCLLFPIFASGVAYDATTIAIGVSGVVGIINAFARENGHRAKSGLSGLLYVGLAVLLSQNVGAGLDVITLSMAIAIGAEGAFETALAAKNKDLQGRRWHFVSGIGSILAATWLTANIPVSSLFAPGAALGARLTSNGATKVAVGLEGKKLADKKSN